MKACLRLFLHTKVLIESDWNLKQYTPEELKAVGEGINRIRLEFKVRKLILV